MLDGTGDGVGTVRTRTMALELPEGGFKFEGGASIAHIDVAYEEYGVPFDGANAVFLCHALTGDAHAAGRHEGDTKTTGWWDAMIGPGRAIDTNRWHVICANVFGGCSGTTGPGSVNPATGKPYGSTFPKHALSDTVDIYRLFLRQLGVKRLAGLLGGSYGGMQAIDWITRCPGEVDKACLVACSASLNTQALAYDAMERSCIVSDSAWKGGDYYGEGDGKGPVKGLALARQIAHVTYLSRELLQKKFARNLQQSFIDAPPADRRAREDAFKTYFQIESYLEYQAAKFLRRFDANSYLHITRAMALFDAAARYGSLAAACARVTGKTLVASYENDVLFTVEQAMEIVEALRGAGKDVRYLHDGAGTGHDSFLSDISKLGPAVKAFLEEAR